MRYQSFILGDVLPLSQLSFTGNNLLIQGVELGIVSVLLHVVSLHTELVSGPVMVGIMTSLPIHEISLILGTDLAGDWVMANPCLCPKPHSSTEPEENELQISRVFPSHT